VPRFRKFADIPKVMSLRIEAGSVDPSSELVLDFQPKLASGN
jgi:hypothetical protein